MYAASLARSPTEWGRCRPARAPSGWLSPPASTRRHERLRHPRPAQLGGGRGQPVGVGRAAAVEDLGERGGEAVRVAGRRGGAEVLALDPLGEVVAAGADDRQARPDAVEQAGAVGEARLEMVAVGGDGAVGLQQPRAALLVRDPAVVEADDAPEQAELAGEVARAGLGVAGLRGARRAHEHEAEPRALRAQPRDGAQDRLGVEPVPDPAVPQHELVLRREPEPLARAGPGRGRRRRGRRTGRRRAARRGSGPRHGPPA